MTAGTFSGSTLENRSKLSILDRILATAPGSTVTAPAIGPRTFSFGWVKSAARARSRNPSQVAVALVSASIPSVAPGVPPLLMSGPRLAVRK